MKVLVLLSFLLGLSAYGQDCNVNCFTYRYGESWPPGGCILRGCDSSASSQQLCKWESINTSNVQVKVCYGDICRGWPALPERFMQSCETETSAWASYCAARIQKQKDYIDAVIANCANKILVVQNPGSCLNGQYYTCDCIDTYWNTLLYDLDGLYKEYTDTVWCACVMVPACDLDSYTKFFRLSTDCPYGMEYTTYMAYLACVDAAWAQFQIKGLTGVSESGNGCYCRYDPVLDEAFYNCWCLEQAYAEFLAIEASCWEYHCTPTEG